MRQVDGVAREEEHWRVSTDSVAVRFQVKCMCVHAGVSVSRLLFIRKRGWRARSHYKFDGSSLFREVGRAGLHQLDSNDLSVVKDLWCWQKNWCTLLSLSHSFLVIEFSKMGHLERKLCLLNPSLMG